MMLRTDASLSLLGGHSKVTKDGIRLTNPMPTVRESGADFSNVTMEAHGLWDR